MVQLQLFGVAVISLLASSACDDRPPQRLNGELVWTSDTQTLSVCGSGEVLWVRVLASNPHFHLSRRVEELTASSSSPILAVLEGEVWLRRQSARTIPSPGSWL
jgi:hypothetical protein